MEIKIAETELGVVELSIVIFPELRNSCLCELKLGVLFTTDNAVGSLVRETQ